MAEDDPAGQSFLGRWSRRKAQARTPEDAPADDMPLESGDDQKAAITKPDEQDLSQQPIDPAILPDIDTLEAGSDFSAFMQAGVPPELKIKALRKLWRVKPELANLDGLIDYGEDLTGSFQVVDKLQTAYQVGKGFFKDEPSEGEAPTKDAPEDAEDADEAVEQGDEDTAGYAGLEETSQASAAPSGEKKDTEQNAPAKA